MPSALDIGIAADLRPEGELPRSGPDDRFEECDSEATVEAIAAALASRGHRPRYLGGGRSFLEEVLARPPALVFNIAPPCARCSGSRSRAAIR